VAIGINRNNNEYTLVDAKRMINVNDDLFVQGKAFFYRDYQVLAASQVVDFVVDPTAFTGINIVALAPTFVSTAGPITVDIYCGITESGDGSNLPLINRRVKIGNPLAQTTLKQDPTTISDLGIKIVGILVPSSGTSPANSSAAPAMQGDEFEIDNTQKYLFRCTNEDGNNVKFEMLFTIFEN
jgi:hypothetical protein